MREIKFRAWDTHKKIMIPNLFGFGQNSDGSTFVSMSNEFCQGDGAYMWNPLHLKLMQFIGLKDKNGKDVYEGDFLSCGDLFVEIVFAGGQFVGKQADTSYEIQNRNWLQFEVIGNRFESEPLRSKFDM